MPPETPVAQHAPPPPGAAAWFSKWVPLPRGVPRGPYTAPTPAILRAVDAGLRRLVTHG